MPDLIVPAGVSDVLDSLWKHGFAAYVVGGAVRDSLLRRPVTDWDVATSALPDQIKELFWAGRYENKFGTVTVPTADGDVQTTTFRRDHQYGDHRRPDSVTFSESVVKDLARRDFTVNAIAWGREPGEDASTFTDPTNGLVDLRRGILRAVGDPATRFEEDGLRLLRAARFAAQLRFEIDGATLDAMRAKAEIVGHVSAERVGGELRRMLAATPPSTAFKILAETGVLAQALPELATQLGVPQDKIPGHDLWLHSLATLDAAAELDPGNDRLRLAALLHDVGKPTTFADGHFVGHDVEGAMLAEALLARLAFARREAEPVGELIRHHMFNYEPRWSNAAVRRFIRRVGRELIDDLLKLRAADNIGSGQPADAGRLAELRQRIDDELSTNPPLSLADLAVHGDDLTTDLGVAPGPLIGELLDRLLGMVIADPRRNRRDVLLAHATVWANEKGESGGA